MVPRYFLVALLVMASAQCPLFDFIAFSAQCPLCDFIASKAYGAAATGMALGWSLAEARRRRRVRAVRGNGRPDASLERLTRKRCNDVNVHSSARAHPSSQPRRDVTTVNGAMRRPSRLGGRRFRPRCCRRGGQHRGCGVRRRQRRRRYDLCLQRRRAHQRGRRRERQRQRRQELR